jgi:hypothetical protein
LIPAAPKLRSLAALEAGITSRPISLATNDRRGKEVELTRHHAVENVELITDTDMNFRFEDKLDTSSVKNGGVTVFVLKLVAVVTAGFIRNSKILTKFLFPGEFEECCRKNTVLPI